MAFNFKDSFKKFTDAAMGTNVNGDAEKSNTHKGFPDYESFPAYDVPEPAQWTGMQGEEKSFSIEGNIVKVNANLDTCIKYYPKFVECAKFYADRFKFKYTHCATDYDSFLHYFQNMYVEGLTPMMQRAYSLFLPLGVYDMEYGEFQKKHSEKYHAAMDVFDTVANIQKKRSQDSLKVANAVTDYNKVDYISSSSRAGLRAERMKADLHDVGTMFASLAVASYMNRVTPEQKIEIWKKIDTTALFQAVYTDYFNTFFTLLQFLSRRGRSVMGGEWYGEGFFDKVSTDISKETRTVYNNLKNPMFPETEFLPTITKIIAKNPFVPEFYDLLESKIGQTDEFKSIKHYFIRK